MWTGEGQVVGGSHIVATDGEELPDAQGACAACRHKEMGEEVPCMQLNKSKG